MNIFWYIDIGISVYQICMHNKRPSRYTWLWVGGWSQRGREWGWCALALALAALAERWPVKCSRNTSPTQPFRYQPPMGQSLIYAGIGGGAGLRGISNFSVGHSSADGHPLTHFCGEWCSVCTLTEWMDRTEARLLVPVPPPQDLWRWMRGTQVRAKTAPNTLSPWWPIGQECSDPGRLSLLLPPCDDWGWE